MKDYAAASQALVGAFNRVWKNKYTIENSSFEPPRNEPWARVTLRFLDGRQASIGGVGIRRFNRTGIMSVQIFVPIGSAMKSQADLAQVIVDGFEGKRITGTSICITAVTPRSIGPDPEGPWYQTNVDVEFTYEVIK